MYEKPAKPYEMLVRALSPRPVRVCRLACALSLASPLGADMPACSGVTVATPYIWQKLRSLCLPASEVFIQY